MTESDMPVFAAALHRLGEVFGEPVSTGRADAYFAALEDLPIEAVLTAARAAIRGSKFFPRPAELRELARQPGSVVIHNLITSWSVPEFRF